MVLSYSWLNFPETCEPKVSWDYCWCSSVAFGGEVNRDADNAGSQPHSQTGVFWLLQVREVKFSLTSV